MSKLLKVKNKGAMLANLRVNENLNPIPPIYPLVSLLAICSPQSPKPPPTSAKITR